MLGKGHVGLCKAPRGEESCRLRGDQDQIKLSLDKRSEKIHTRPILCFNAANFDWMLARRLSTVTFEVLNCCISLVILFMLSIGEFCELSSLLVTLLTAKQTSQNQATQTSYRQNTDDFTGRQKLARLSEVQKTIHDKCKEDLNKWLKRFSWQKSAMQVTLNLSWSRLVQEITMVHL